MAVLRAGRRIYYALLAVISKLRKKGNDVVVVVSAMGDTTDELIDQALSRPRTLLHREMDMLS